MAFNMFDLSHFHEDSVEDHSKSDEDDDYPSILRSDLTTLASGQRITFGIAVAVLCVLSLSGNVGTLYVNHKRKVRVFFRVCLISLAFSDLITTVFLTIGYLAQFAAPSVQIWLLGGIMCGFIPFVTTGAILVSSMTLVGIALDRYFAVMKAVIGFWNPNRTFSIIYAVCIWGLSFGIASPVYSAYTICEVYVLSTDVVGVDGAGSKELIEVDLVSMCVSDKDSNAYYYIVVVAIIFVPTLVAFVWLNSIIANKLWIRRHSVVASPSPASPSASPAAPPATPTTSALSTVAGAFRKPVPEHQKQMEMIQKQQQQLYPHACHCQLGNKICISSSMLTVPTSLTTTTATTAAGTKSPTSNPKSSASASASVATPTIGGGGNSAKHISSREARHLRMFTIVLILMAVFIFFRLPAWIFLIMRMYGTYTRPVHWILHFSFGTLTLASCVLNPLLYTFLAETIQYAMFMKGKLCGLRRYFGNCCARTATRARTRTSGCHSCWLWCDSSGRGGDDNDDQKMSQNQHQNANQNQHDNANADNDNDNDNGSDSRSNDGAKSTSKKSDDDSKVYTIIPVLWEGGGHVAGRG